MSGERWKRQERQIAAVLGGERLPSTGRSQADVRRPGWAVQVKTRTALPAWRWAAVAQAERDAHDGERPVLVPAEVRQGIKARRLAVLPLEVFAALIGQGADSHAGGSDTQRETAAGGGGAADDGRRGGGGAGRGL